MTSAKIRQMVENGHAAVVQPPIALLDDEGLRFEILAVGLHEIGLRMSNPQIPAFRKAILMWKAQRMFTALEKLRIKQMTTVKT